MRVSLAIPGFVLLLIKVVTAFLITPLSGRSCPPFQCRCIIEPHPNDPDDEASQQSQSIRLNKVLSKTHSRRAADALIAQGRVTVNGSIPTSMGLLVRSQDVVLLDGVIVEWPTAASVLDTAANHVYIKYWKPVGVVCTTDRRIRNNILDSMVMGDGGGPALLPPRRIFPVGRLDQDTSGVILLTSDGRVPNAVLKGETKQPKTYHVTVDRPVRPNDVIRLREGVVITTEAVRDGRRKTLTATTRPAHVVMLLPGNRNQLLEITISEGRNRQVRKMLGALGYQVKELKRVEFMGITLDDLERPGDWKTLDKREMQRIEQAIDKSRRNDTT